MCRVGVTFFFDNSGTVREERFCCLRKSSVARQISPLLFLFLFSFFFCLVFLCVSWPVLLLIWPEQNLTPWKLGRLLYVLALVSTFTLSSLVP